MNRLITALVLCVLLVWGCIWSYSTVDQTVNDITADIEAGDLESAYAKWTDAETRFGVLLIHDELDKAELLFARVMSAKEAGETEELASEQAELLAQLRSLPELETPSLKNIF